MQFETDTKKNAIKEEGGYSLISRKKFKPDLLKRDHEYHTFGFNRQSFLLDGQSFFVLSGEMHYFRIDAALWPKHLRKIKEAGLNTVSSYIPWSLHEEVEGCVDFEGKSRANLNLQYFIELCNVMGLKLILKPGPYILAELSMHGIPRWFFDKYPDALACDAEGKPYPQKFTTLNHPVFEEKTLQWYDHIMPFLSDYQISKGGPVILMQVCNEVGLFQWLGSKGDYNPVSLKAYREYLAATYKSIDQLNDRYGSDYKQWDQVPAPSGSIKTLEDHFGYHDWHVYHRVLYADYIKWLIDNIRQRQIDVPLFHNVPGWVFGRAKDMTVCLSMYDKLAREYPDIILSVDHIPENLSYRNFHDDRLINEFTKALQGGAGPLYVAELQSGTREANVRVYPNEMELFYKSCLANGVVSMNFYMYCQGQNPKGWGVYDSSFYLQTPLDVSGNPGESYATTENIAKLITTNGSRLCECSSEAKQALLYYPPYYYREFTRPLFSGENYTDLSLCGTKLDPKFITDELLFDGVGKMLAKDNQEYNAVDLSNTNLEKLKMYKQIWFAATEYMDEKEQRLLLGYVQQGGHLICFPTIPKMNFDGTSCTVLAEGLNVQTDQVLDDFEGMICWRDTNEEIHAMSYIETFEEKNKEVIARTRNGKACGITVKTGKGSATIFGTGFMYQASAHEQAWQKLGLSEDFIGPVQCDNPLIATRTRFHQDQGGYLFLLNYHNQEHQTKAFVLGQDMPSTGQFYLPPISGLMIPFDIPVTEDVTLQRTTSEVINMDVKGDTVILHLSGHEKTPGQCLFRTKRTAIAVRINGRDIDILQSSGEGVQIEYTHTDQVTELEIQFGDLSY